VSWRSWAVGSGAESVGTLSGDHLRQLKKPAESKNCVGLITQLSDNQLLGCLTVAEYLQRSLVNYYLSTIPLPGVSLKEWARLIRSCTNKTSCMLAWTHGTLTLV